MDRLIQYQVYLRAELGKFGLESECQRWLSDSARAKNASNFGVPVEQTEMNETFASQEMVDSFVSTLDDTCLVGLTKILDVDWRRNGVFEKLGAPGTWAKLNVPVGSTKVQQAEPDLGLLFARRDFSLKALASDKELFRHPPYVHWRPGVEIPFDECLGEGSVEECTLFDGIHRAIYMAWERQPSINVWLREKHDACSR